MAASDVVGSLYTHKFAPNDKAPEPGRVQKGDAKEGLFSPFKVRSVTLKNRIVVSPMCQYSCKDGLPNDYHLVHLGGFARYGAGLIIAEATAVQPNGRITPQCTGIWSDEHIAPWQRITAFAKAYGAVPGIQLAHAGQKGSTYSPFQGGDGVVGESEGGWPTNVVSPSGLQFQPNYPVPRALTVAEIKQLVEDFKQAAIRADKAGFEVIEIHGAHGYLIHSFLSPLTNKRTDYYGGSFENRIRVAVEIATAIRSVWPATKPLFFRSSAHDWASEGGWLPEDTVSLARALLIVGVDVVDCSSGANLPFTDSRNIMLKHFGPKGWQVPFAEKVRTEVKGMASMAVGAITDGKQADAIIREGRADLIAVGKQFLRDTNLVITWGHELGYDITMGPQVHVWVGPKKERPAAPVAVDPARVARKNWLLGAGALALLGGVAALAYRGSSSSSVVQKK